MKKGQEEIVGFVLIMVIVAVVFLILLSISLRTPDSGRDSREVYQFLESLGEYTTECEMRNGFEDASGLMKSCLENERCLDTRDACKVLEETLIEALDSSWNVGNESNVKGYRFSSFYEVNSDSEVVDEILSLEKGICDGQNVGASYLIPAFPGRISWVMEICY